MSNKKANQLGMNPSTARHRLIKDVLFKLICETGNNKCFQCGEPMERDTFSIEHKTPWLDSDNPIELYFDLENISYSHLSCNVASARRTGHVCGTVSNYDKHGCRCDDCKAAKSSQRKLYYDANKRREQYKRNGT